MKGVGVNSVDRRQADTCLGAPALCQGSVAGPAVPSPTTGSWHGTRPKATPLFISFLLMFTLTPFYPLHASLFLRSSRFAHPPPAERKHQEGRNRHLFPPLTDPWAPGTEPHRWGTLLKRNHQMPKWWMKGAKAHGALLTSTAPAAQGKRNAWT